MATYLGPMNYVASGASAIVVSSLFNGLEVRPACLHARLSTAGSAPPMPEPVPSQCGARPPVAIASSYGCTACTA